MITEMPVPKYKINDVFWIASSESRAVQLPCPDCLGEKIWKIVSPGGGDLTVECPRCGQGGYSADGKLPSLVYIVHEPIVKKFIVGGIEVRSHSYEDNPTARRVQYSSSPRGGTVIYEEDAFETEDAAMAAARIKTDAMNTAIRADPEHLEKVRFSSLKIQDAFIEHTHTSIWHAWYALRALREDIEQALEGRSGEALADEIQRHLDFDRDFRQQVPCPEPLYMALDELVRVMESQEGMTDATVRMVLEGDAMAKAKVALTQYLPKRSERETSP